MFRLSCVIAVLAAFILPISLSAETLSQTIMRLEHQLDGRIGVAIYDSGSGEVWAHRADERFLMNSTVKVLVCAAVLSQDDLDLTETLLVREVDVVGHAPVTLFRIGERMSISDLCLAAVDQSDNGATNVLFDWLGGPDQVTDFLRRMGDTVTRSDRIEPVLNTFVAGDPRDTTSPAAMVRTLDDLLTGSVLTAQRRDLLAEWMRPGSWTGALIRPSVPSDWDVVDKSGSGRHTRTLIAMLTPPSGAPIFVSLSISDTDANFATRNAVLSDLGASVMVMLLAR